MLAVWVPVPLFLQSLPLAFQTFWRYLLLLPILAVIAIVLSLVAGLIPLVNLLVPDTVSAFFIIMGLRCALTARGKPSEAGFGQLLYISVLFCIINAVALFVASWLSAGMNLAVVQFSGLTPENAQANVPTLATVVIINLFVTVLPAAIYASVMAVPMTAAVASESSRTSGRDIFFGLGSGIVSLGLISAIWLGFGHFFAIFGEVWTMFAMIMSALFAVMRADTIPWDWSFSPLTLMGSTVFMTWASSWFYATAVLAWEGACSRRDASRAKTTNAGRVGTDTLRSLRETRTQGLRGG